jgi:Putative transposase
MGAAGDADKNSTSANVIFHPATGIDVDAVLQVQATLGKRILRAFVGCGLLQSFDAKNMLTYQHSGFSLDVVVCALRATTAQPKRASAHYLWAILIARIYEVFPLLCPICGGPMRIIAFITHSADIRRILDHIGVES